MIFPKPRQAVFALALLSPALASAQVSAPGPAAGPAAIHGVAPHSCGRAHYPAIAVRMNMQGNTVIGYTINTDGTIKDIAVVKSSGSKELDQAALDCAHDWRYKPATQNGKPIAVPWRATVQWRLWDSFAMPRAGESYTCPEHHSDPARSGTPLPVLLQLSVDADGNVSKAEIRMPSGDAVFDKYVLACVSQWHYTAPQRDGVPVPSSAQPVVSWDGAPRPPSTLPTLASTGGDDCTRHPQTPGAAAPGAAQVLFEVETDGKVSNARLAQTSGDGAYDAYVVTCVAKWTYNPSMMMGHPRLITWQTNVTWTQS